MNLTKKLLLGLAASTMLLSGCGNKGSDYVNPKFAELFEGYYSYAISIRHEFVGSGTYFDEECEFYRSYVYNITTHTHTSSSDTDYVTLWEHIYLVTYVVATEDIYVENVEFHYTTVTNIGYVPSTL